MVETITAIGQKGKMMRLIDADELMKFPIRRDNYDRENGNEHFINGIETVLEYVEKMPAIEVIPIEWLEGKIRVLAEGGLTTYASFMAEIIEMWIAETELENHIDQYIFDKLSEERND